MKQYVGIKLTANAALIATVFGLIACDSDSIDVTDLNTNDAAETGETADSEIYFVAIDAVQNECYENEGDLISCPLDGESLHDQDAQYEGIQASYADNADNTVSDNNTGLMWQLTPDLSRYS